MSQRPKLGVIEGFFGPPWPKAERLALAPFLQQQGFDFYIYAPKADPHLRKKWREPFSKEYLQELRLFAKEFKQRGLKFGVGFSPFGLHSEFSAGAREDLQRQLLLLNEVGIDLLGLFFDDMPVAEGLAARQLEALEVVRQEVSAKVLFCPSFYSFDPILEKVFGKRPERYWQEIATAPKDIELLWTGPKVLSDEISAEHLLEVAHLLGRRPFLWDNLFANDGPRNCKFLKIRPLLGRKPEAFAAANGWAWNPMNQGALSRLVLLSARKVEVGAEPEAALRESFHEHCAPALALFLERHFEEFLQKGLEQISADQKAEWLAELAIYPGAIAAEISAWLRGEFQVGSECLTD